MHLVGFTPPWLWPPNSLDLNTVECEACRDESAVPGSTVSTTLNTVLSKSGIASTTESSTKLFDSGVFNCMAIRVFVRTEVTLSSRCRFLTNLCTLIGHFSFIVQICERLYLRTTQGRLLKFVKQIAVVVVYRIVTLCSSYAAVFWYCIFN